MQSASPTRFRPFTGTHLAVILAALTASLGACRPHSKADAGDAATPATSGGPVVAAAGLGDAGGDGAAAVDARPLDRTLRVVAESDYTGARFDITATDRAFVLSGPFVYDPKPDGSLALVGKPASYLPVFGGAEETLVGFFRHLQSDRVIALPDGSLDVKLVGDEPYGFHFERDVATVVDAKSFGQAVTAAPPITFPFAVAGGGPGMPVGACFRIPSFDGKTYAHCRPLPKGKSSIHVRAGGEGSPWSEVFASAADAIEKEPLPRGLSVAKDGELYALSPKHDAVVRCPTVGPCEQLAVDLSGGPKTHASYSTRDTDLLERDSSRYFLSFEATTRPAVSEKTTVAFDAVVARSASDVWAFGRAMPFANRVIVHSGAQRERVALPSVVDARVLVRNERAPATWVGHCEQVFVRMAGARIAGSEGATVDAGPAKARIAELKPILEQRADDDYFGAPLSWALVAGRLHDEHVVGLVVARADGEVALDRMERAVEKVVEKLTTNPMSRPRVTCTVPVLSEVLATRAPPTPE